MRDGDEDKSRGINSIEGKEEREIRLNGWDGRRGSFAARVCKR